MRTESVHEREFMPEPHLYLVGDGPDRGSMETLATKLDIAPYVHFTGFVADPRPYLASADVFALISHQDPCPLVITEAREAGCAIVAPRVGGIPEMLDGGAAGVLVPAGDPSQTAAKLRWLLLDSQAYGQFAARAGEPSAVLGRAGDRRIHGDLSAHARGTRIDAALASTARRAPRAPGWRDVNDVSTTKGNAKMRAKLGKRRTTDRARLPEQSYKCRICI